FQEVRSFARLERVGARLLKLILEAIRRAGGPGITSGIERLMRELIDVLETIGPRWPGVACFMPLRIPKFNYSAGGAGQFIWARVIVTLGGVDSSVVSRLATTGTYYGVRSGAMRLLAEKWSDQTTRDLLTERSVQDDNEYTRTAALQALAEKWPDQATRDLLAQRAVQDDNEYTRRAALQALAEKWSDQTTRDLLTQRALQDDNEYTRRAALQALAEKWSDQTTRDLLAERSVQDDNEYTRRAALQVLAEKWPDQP